MIDISNREELDGEPSEPLEPTNELSTIFQEEWYATIFKGKDTGTTYMRLRNIKRHSQLWFKICKATTHPEEGK